MSTPTGVAMRAHFPIFAETEPPFHFLDNAATSQICAASLEALLEFESKNRANVKRGVYRLADRATQEYERARKSVAAFLNVSKPNEVVLTSGTTMGLNLAAAILVPRLQPGDQILISELEHHSNIVPWQLHAKRHHVGIKPIRVDSDGRLDLDELDERDTSAVRIIAATHSSNVTGAVSDLARLRRIANKSAALLVVDGAQRAPHGPIDVPALACDMYALSSHKMFGPTGAGALWGRRDLMAELPPFMGGGEMIARVTIEDSNYAPPPHRFEAGTPPIGSIIGMGAAARWMLDLDWLALAAHQTALTEKMINRLQSIDCLDIIGPRSTDQRTGVVAFDIEGLHPHDICQMLDGFGVCLRGGHHCAQPLMDKFDLAATSRASLAPYNDDDDIDALIDGLQATVARLR